MEKEIIMELIKQAKEIANRNFCCKHSNFTVGAALMKKKIGDIVTVEAPNGNYQYKILDIKRN